MIRSPVIFGIADMSTMRSGPAMPRIPATYGTASAVSGGSTGRAEESRDAFEQASTMSSDIRPADTRDARDEVRAM